MSCRFRDKVVKDPYGALLNWNRNDGEENPCSWFGIECSDGRVVILNLKDLCLEGTISPKLRNLTRVKSIQSAHQWHPGQCYRSLVSWSDFSIINVTSVPTKNASERRPIVLRNNSFSGAIPEEIKDLEDLEVLDLGYNNFSGPLPVDLGSNLSLTILLLDNNEFSRGISIS
ncbi:hypothetical protein IFM89_033861 [Coptis chinensis]|uniref:Leucine-rich repeat-containing N-terminal plant-type domain-containing protein n=1 Tax=Coptis chinensis TaxID=261450 RepID=A0A835LDA5_9MAGN|nr:hypothetical protein IFM89_033861 [Coptis chinensis]